MPETDTKTPGDSAEPLTESIPKPALTQSEQKQLKSEAAQAEETPLYKELKPRIEKIANMSTVERETALDQLKVLCKDATAANIAASNALYRSRVLARAMVSAFEQKDPRVIKMAVRKAKLKDDKGTAKILMDMVEGNIMTRKFLNSIGVHLTKRKIHNKKQIEVTSVQMKKLADLFSTEELNKLFKVK